MTTVRFPDEPGFAGRYAPMRLEGEIRGLEVIQGEVPETLRGTYYRVQDARRAARQLG